ncbi:50S ribosomal protein L18 [Piscirickettsia salmonis]|uniref:Large ribosomal subunit protein uL18 n=1 Tax=Piscirickettsia salmonis TaxID=1238 RepID=A0A0B8UFR0_PISSA|nr:50S ribosomal protein L18 [Piscirickettsia salmonis]RNC79221.1 50S ribosomal protein L18 [Piscirickettsiaceae bacterium NZ-RLO2]AKP72530.1 50S ribosomal protein L18 [Piscirickettsia salmonis LF-89 = ATCC VR-1361]ALA23811.1 50S ribosomal protein L18 [Piscirickettsia salmonis]ALB24000.1 50S ribosomal protein L18 [Piscirickettsia salmonis]ALY03814.1 50S ribosomal protein L18 [Piscirickettsia salmonis]
MDKKTSRLRRAGGTRARIREQGVNRLSIHRTPRHTYAQVIEATSGRVLAAASTLDKSYKEVGKPTGNVAAASEIGKLIAERAVAAGVTQVAFDRSGFKYHGRVKALADAARANGLQF